MLQELGLRFTIVPAEIDEMPHMGERPDLFASRMAIEKAAVVAEEHTDSLVIAADTVVALGEKIFGKPTSPEDALSILQSLRGKQHTVITGVAVIWRREHVSDNFTTLTKVTFGDFDDTVLRAYVKSKDPLDKAGAYGIQSFGGFLVQSITGSYSNVVGLPSFELITFLLKHNIISGC